MKALEMILTPSGDNPIGRRAMVYPDGDEVIARVMDPDQTHTIQALGFTAEQSRGQMIAVLGDLDYARREFDGMPASLRPSLDGSHVCTMQVVDIVELPA